MFLRPHLHRALLSLSVCLLFATPQLQAQEEDIKHNPLSLYPVPYDRVLFSRTIWRRIDLNEKQNQPFFTREREISTIIINAVKNDLLTPYNNDSVLTPMSKADFLQGLQLPDEGSGLTEEERALGFADDDATGGDWGGDGDGDPQAIPESNEYATRDFSLIEIKEDYFFDRVRSRMYHDIHVITIILPADKNPAAFEKPLASFRFVDLNRLFRAMPDRAIWFNRKNPARHLNMIDAFHLRLFSSLITKIANPNDDAIVDIYSTSRKAATIAAQQAEHALIDFETQLWEY